MHWCSFADVVQIHVLGHYTVTSMYRQGHGDRTSHAMIIKALFLSSKGSPRCTRKDQCLLPLPDGAALSLLFVKQLAVNSGRVPQMARKPEFRELIPS